MANLNEPDDATPEFYVEPPPEPTQLGKWGFGNSNASPTSGYMGMPATVNSINNMSFGSDYMALELIKMHEEAKKWQNDVNDLPLKKYNVTFKGGTTTYLECRYLDLMSSHEFIHAYREIKDVKQPNHYIKGVATVVGEGFVALAKSEVLMIKEVV